MKKMSKILTIVLAMFILITAVPFAMQVSAADNTRTIIIEMHDEYGDGWNNAELIIKINGEIYDSVTMEYDDDDSFGSGSGQPPQYYAFDINESDELALFWRKGRYDGECAFIAYYEDQPPVTAFDPEDSEYSDANAIFFVTYEKIKKATYNYLVNQLYPTAVRPDFWTDEGIRSNSFSSIDEANKVLKISSAEELGLFAWNIMKYFVEEELSEEYIDDDDEAYEEYIENLNKSIFKYAGWTIELTNNIDLSGKYWNPVMLFGVNADYYADEEEFISFEENYMKYNYKEEDKIVFNGNGYKITGLNVIAGMPTVFFLTGIDEIDPFDNGYGEGMVSERPVLMAASAGKPLLKGSLGSERFGVYFETNAMGLFSGLCNVSVTDLVISQSNIERDSYEDEPLMAGVLAGVADSSEIRRVYIENPTININTENEFFGSAIGGIVGYISNETRLNDASVIGGSISNSAGNFGGNSYIGGICGIDYRSSIVNTASDTTINYAFSPWNVSYVGGIVGSSSVFDGYDIGICVLNNYSRTQINLKYNEDFDISDYSEGEYTLFVGGIAGVLEDSAINNYYIPKVNGGIKALDAGITSNGELYIGELFGSILNEGHEFTIIRNYFDGSATSGASGGKAAAQSSDDWKLSAQAYTTAVELLDLLNAGREAVADEIALNPNAPGRDEIMSLIRVWGINPDNNNGLPLFASAPELGQITAPEAVKEGQKLNLTPSTPIITSNDALITKQGWQISANGIDGWKEFDPSTELSLDNNGNYLRYYATSAFGTVYSNNVQITVLKNGSGETVPDTGDVNNMIVCVIACIGLLGIVYIIKINKKVKRNNNG